ncbi:MAG: flagellar hook-associated protein FlgK [Actinobacteria bacterium]|nr:flagellar hook-associated protein FlgK [Actinomycetota bacterium]
MSSSPFFGFSIGVKALSAAQRALEVVSHNIANVNTRGYSRQESIMRTSDPQYVPSLNRSISAGQIGTGVDISEVRRLHDKYIEKQLINERQNSGKWDIGLRALEQIEGIFSEPSENGLQNMIDIYWNSWKDLESSPEDNAVRKNLVENSRSLCNFIHSIHERLELLRKDLNTEVKNKVDLINNYSGQIKELNDLIKDVTTVGDNANDLEDRRDLLIRELSQVVNITVVHSKYGQKDIFIGGTALVRGGNSYGIEAALNPGTGFYDVLWKDSGSTVDISNGELYSLLNFRDTYINDVIGRMDDLVSELITRTNTVHSTGYGLDGSSTGYDFFTGTGVEDIEVNGDIIADISLIAAAKSPDQSGDNSNVTDILALREQLFLSGNTATFDDYYNNLIVKIGVDTQQCTREMENTELLIEKINLRREAISGVSTDDELVDMVKYQHAYNAAARVISTMDEMLETIIERMGA